MLLVRIASIALLPALTGTTAFADLESPIANELNHSPDKCRLRQIDVDISLSNQSLKVEYKIKFRSNTKTGSATKANCRLTWHLGEEIGEPQKIIQSTNLAAKDLAAADKYIINIEKPWRAIRNELNFQIPLPAADNASLAIEAKLETIDFSNYYFSKIGQLDRLKRKLMPGKIVISASSEGGISVNTPLVLHAAMPKKLKQIGWQGQNESYLSFYPNVPKFKRPLAKETIVIWGSTYSERGQHNHRMHWLRNFLEEKDPSHLRIYTAGLKLERHTDDLGSNWQETLNALVPIIYEGTLASHDLGSRLKMNLGNKQNKKMDIVFMLDDLDSIDEDQLDETFRQFKRHNLIVLLAKVTGDNAKKYRQYVKDYQVSFLPELTLPTVDQLKYYPWVFKTKIIDADKFTPLSSWVFPKEGIIARLNPSPSPVLSSIKFYQKKIGHRELIKFGPIAAKPLLSPSPQSAANATNPQKYWDLGTPTIKAAISQAAALYRAGASEEANRSLSSLFEMKEVSPFTALAAANLLAGWGNSELANSIFANSPTVLGSNLIELAESIEALSFKIKPTPGENDYHSCSPTSENKASLFQEHLEATHCALKKGHRLLASPNKSPQSPLHYSLHVVSVGLGSVSVSLEEPTPHRQSRQIAKLTGPISLSSFWLANPYAGEHHIYIKRRAPLNASEGPVTNRLLVYKHTESGDELIQDQSFVSEWGSQNNRALKVPIKADAGQVFDPAAHDATLTAQSLIENLRYHAAISELATKKFAGTPALEAERLVHLGAAHLAIGNRQTAERLWQDAELINPYYVGLSIHRAAAAALAGNAALAAKEIRTFLGNTLLPSFKTTTALLRRIKDEPWFIAVHKEPEFFSLIRELENSLTKNWPLHHFMSKSGAGTEEEATY